MDALAGYGSDEGETSEINYGPTKTDEIENNVDSAFGEQRSDSLNGVEMTKTQTQHRRLSSTNSEAMDDYGEITGPKSPEKRELDRSLKAECTAAETPNGELNNAHQAKTTEKTTGTICAKNDYHCDNKRRRSDSSRKDSRSRSRSRSKSAHRSSHSRSHTPERSSRKKSKRSHSRDYSRSRSRESRSRTHSRSPPAHYRHGQKHSKSSKHTEKKLSRSGEHRKSHYNSDSHHSSRRNPRSGSRDHHRRSSRSRSRERSRRRRSRSRSYDRGSSKRSRSHSRSRRSKRSRSRDRSNRYRSRSRSFEKYPKKSSAGSGDGKSVAKTQAGSDVASVASEESKKSTDVSAVEIISHLPLNRAELKAHQMTPQMAVQQAMAAVNAKAQQLTGIALPKYYNPAAVNPMKYAEQMQKRRLLWHTDKAQADQPVATSSNNNWESTTFAQDQDGKMTAKFRKLMGIKSEGVTTATAASNEPVGSTDPVTGLPVGSEEQIRKQEEMFRKLDQQYEVARMSTHTHRGVGLGFTSQAHHLFPK